MSQRTEIENALYRWAWAYDECDLEAFLEALTEDATVKVEDAGGGIVGPLVGHDEIGAFFGSRLAVRTDARRHITTNVIIDAESEDEATTRCYLTLVKYEDGLPTLAGTGWYRDTLVKRDGVWRIKDRHAYLETIGIPKP
jgi:ketosteroid isomerase-like protein